MNNPFPPYEYQWLHIPTGKTGTSTVEALSRNQFLEKLATWNSALPGLWQYFE